MDSKPSAAFAWINSPLDEFLVGSGVKEEEVDEGRLKVEAFFALGGLVDPFRVPSLPAPLPPSSWAATVWQASQSFLFTARRLEAGPLVRPLEPGQLSRRFAKV